MPTIALHFENVPEDDGVLVAELAEWGCEAFQDSGDALIAFLDAAVWEARAADAATAFAAFTSIIPRVEFIPDRNWNEEWEQSIQPLRVGNYCVHPSWHQGDLDSIPIVIDPKMSFGTGYHQSTRLILRALSDHVSPGMRVLDAGTGTGILAIAALKSGARAALGFDVDLNSYENALENAALNDVTDRFSIILGDIVDVDDTGFDLVLANINRETLRAMMPDLRSKMKDDGVIAFSGLLLRDRPLMMEAFRDAGLIPFKELEEGEWWSSWCRKDFEAKTY